MKKWLILVTACLALHSQAYAFYSGFYIGGHGAVASDTSYHSDFDKFLFTATTYPTTDTSWAVGMQLGYDWVGCNRLLGLVVDWDWSDAKTHVHVIPHRSDINDELTRKRRWCTTLRARGGLVWNSVLVYVTGGAVLADLTTHMSSNGDGNLVTEHFLFHKHRWGWITGFGAEFALGCHWSLLAEWQYMLFKTHRETFFSPAQRRTVSFGFADEAWSGRIGLNYRFSLHDLCTFW